MLLFGLAAAEVFAHKVQYFEKCFVLLKVVMDNWRCFCLGWVLDLIVYCLVMQHR